MGPRPNSRVLLFQAACSEREFIGGDLSRPLGIFGEAISRPGENNFLLRGERGDHHD